MIPEYQIEISQKKTSLFLKLMCSASVFFCICILLLWLIPFVGLAGIHKYLPHAFGILCGIIVLAITSFSFALMFHLKTGIAFVPLAQLRKFLIKILFPSIEYFAAFIGISRESVRGSCIHVNNALVAKSAKKVKTYEILLLLPHCTQNSECQHKLSVDVENCVRCGKCDIAYILRLKDLYHFGLFVVNGGTAARRIVIATKPRLIIAVACERDLSSGIQDTYPLPVFGIINERPHGPCLNTRFNCDKIQKAIDFFT